MSTLTQVTPTQINKNFVIRWRYADEPTSTFDRLIGAGRFAEKFGERYADKFFNKALESGENKVQFKIRGLYNITFAAK